MNIQNPPLPPGPHSAPSLKEFADAAQDSEYISIQNDGRTWQVKGRGSMPESGLSVAWVQSEDDADVDATPVFFQALENAFTGKISSAVFDALDVSGSSSNQGLSSRIVKKAIDMAETGQKALAGVDFLTRLHFSASRNGAEFKRVCAQAGVSPAAFSASDLNRIDGALDERFNLALSQGNVPVAYADAERWLKEILEQS